MLGEVCVFVNSSRVPGIYAKVTNVFEFIEFELSLTNGESTVGMVKVLKKWAHGACSFISSKVLSVSTGIRNMNR